MQRRIFGTECEYALVVQRQTQGARHPPDSENLLDEQKKMAAQLMTGAATLKIPIAGEFLGNGGRLYVDRGGHPEYATPECCQVADLMTYELAGDRLLQKMLQTLNNCDSGRRLCLYKNNVDLYGHTYGGHENYLITPQAMDGIHRLLPFLVTRQVISGAGKVMTSQYDGYSGYQISQRADFFDWTYNDRTSEVRGIINIRKREITRANQNRRLHLIIGDSNMNPYTIGLKIGTTALMLRLLEAGALQDNFEVLDPPGALKAISRNPSAGVQCRYRGRQVAFTALDIQSICLASALEFFAGQYCDPEESQWLKVWERVLIGLKTLAIHPSARVLERDDADLKRQIDWIMKLWLIDRRRSSGAPEAHFKKMDFAYHNLDPESGLYERCRSLDLVDAVIPENQIAAAGLNPPQNTRARLRGMVIQRCFGTNVTASVENWERINVSAGLSTTDSQHCFNRLKREMNKITLHLADPFQWENSEAMDAFHRFMDKWDNDDDG